MLLYQRAFTVNTQTHVSKRFSFQVTLEDSIFYVSTERLGYPEESTLRGLTPASNSRTEAAFFTEPRSFLWSAAMASIHDAQKPARLTTRHRTRRDSALPQSCAASVTCSGEQRFVFVVGGGNDLRRQPNEWAGTVASSRSTSWEGPLCTLTRSLTRNPRLGPMTRSVSEGGPVDTVRWKERGE